MAAELGFEPRQTESESVVLTVTLFGNNFNDDYITTFPVFCQVKFLLFLGKSFKSFLKLFFCCDKMKKKQERCHFYEKVF